MYHLSFHENGRFVTEIGGPLNTIAEAVDQIAKLTDGAGCSPADGVVGCTWDRGGTTCHLIVVNDLWIPITDKEAGK